MKRFLKRLALGFIFALPWIGAASAQQVNLYCWVDNGPPIHWAPCSSTNPLQITGSLSIAGTTSNASSGVATSSTNLPTVSYNYGFNGTTWDQLQVDGSKNLKVNVVTGGGGSQADQSAWTQGTTAFAPGGGVFNDTATLTSGQQGTLRLTTKRAAIVDVDTSGNALYSAITAAVPWFATTAWNTNTYTNGTTNPGAADLHGNPWVDIGGVGGSAFALGQQLAAASLPVVLTAAQITTLTPPTTVTANGAANVTPTDCSGTITSGGSAQSAIAAQTTLHGFTIANIDTGHNAEVLWVSFTTTAASLTAGSFPLPAPTATTFAGFGSFTTPPGFGTNHAVSIIGATTGHIFSCSWW